MKKKVLQQVKSLIRQRNKLRKNGLSEINSEIDNLKSKAVQLRKNWQKTCDHRFVRYAWKGLFKFSDEFEDIRYECQICGERRDESNAPESFVTTVIWDYGHKTPEIPEDRIKEKEMKEEQIDLINTQIQELNLRKEEVEKTIEALDEELDAICDIVHEALGTPKTKIVEVTKHPYNIFYDD